MFSYLPLLVGLLLSFLHLTAAQQPSGYYIPNDYAGLSTNCRQALNTTINCSLVVATNSLQRERLVPDALTALCTTNCLNSLQSAKTTIEQQCVGSGDRIVWGGVDYPASVFVNHYLYSYKLSCRRDSATNNYCDTVFTSWLNVPGWSSAQNCSDCNLGTMETHLNSPFSYDDDMLAKFKYLTSSCSKTTYTFTKPPVYGIRTAATTSSASAAASSGTSSAASSSGAAASSTRTTSAAAPTLSCASTYTTNSTDNCYTVALSQGVSTYSIAALNSLSFDCASVTRNQTLCLGPKCTPYAVQVNDTCTSIVSKVGKGLTITNLLSWNPNINALCNNLFEYTNTVLCVSSPGGVRNYGESSVLAQTSTYSTPTSSQPYTLASQSYNTTSFATTASRVPIPTASVLPRAPGSRADCQVYRDYLNITAVSDQYQIGHGVGMSLSTNNCSQVSYEFSVPVSSLLAWNPSLNASNCVLQPGYTYCASLNAKNATITSSCTPGNWTTANGTISCPCYARVYASDASYYNCSKLAAAYRITVPQLAQWNGWTVANCDTSMYKGLVSNSTAYYLNNTVCVRAPTFLGGNATTTLSSTSSKTSTTSSTSTTSKSSSSSTSSSSSSSRLSSTSSSSSSAAPAASGVPATVGGYASQGCYSDNNGGHTLATRVTSASMTLDMCKDSATAAGAIYFGVEYGQECWYDNALGGTNGPLAQSKCNMACPGNSAQWCGGSNALQLYKKI